MQLYTKRFILLKVTGIKFLLIFLFFEQRWEMEVNYTSDAAKKLFLTNIFGENLERNGHDYSNASAGEIVNYMENDLFEIKQECSDELLLKMLAVRYNVYAISSQNI